MLNHRRSNTLHDRKTKYLLLSPSSPLQSVVSYIRHSVRTLLPPFPPGSSLTGNGLLVSDGEVHKRQRRLSNPAFRRAAVEAYAAAMVSAAQRLLGSRWQQPGVHVHEVLQDQKGLFHAADNHHSDAAPVLPTS